MNILSEVQAVSFQGGDSNSKRAKFEQEIEVKPVEKSNIVETVCTDQDQPVDGPKETTVGMSDVSTVVRIEKPGYDELPKELNEMKIRDEKSKNNNDKVFHAIHLSLIFHIVLILVTALLIYICEIISFRYFLFITSEDTATSSHKTNYFCV